VSDPGRFTFEPLLNLLNGRAVGMEVVRTQARDRTGHVAASAVWGTRQLAEFDSGIAIAAVLHGTEYDATVALHVDVLADTVVAARRRVRRLRTVLQRRDPHRPAPTVVLEIGPALSAAPPAALAEGVAELREDGYGIAFDGVGRGFGLDLVAELTPDLVKIDPHLVERLPRCPRARAVVTALGDVCRAVGVRVSATGVRTPEELAAVRDHGIPWGQGPLLATPRRRPSTAGIVLPSELMPHASPAPAAAGTAPPAPRPPVPVSAIAQAPLCLPEDVTAEAVRQALADHPQAGSVVLLDPYRRPVGFLDRNRFMLTISGPFGRALFAQRPARSLTEPARTLPAGTDVRTAVARCLAGDRSRTHDDVVLVDGDGGCVGIVRIGDLLQEAATTAA
jgi:EAL domain-containing protein (putative c-di-GMP-specific phosphodiesterase class I)